MKDTIKLKFWWVMYTIINNIQNLFRDINFRVWNIYYRYSQRIYNEYVYKDK